ncbi:MDR family MFS transporter [Fructilactobacillus fructivorans]|uniref:Permease of the major facilitator superfamily n=1 Tax=Fructilactobacillus fructivorans TaxID=1614 RepID=A0A0C1Q2M1_9LACO|nr:MDR family MFS transporter [Fructilactobacillus fructivorans]KID42063.1 Permease of the major facilitator superfamily [Fructilactobacillus fructivorans]MCT0151955.1 DHA2 family efflux MFS transporter permease subunit [Fructilactobacillus fructivorans]MCT2867847.1 DHA2 family efflux MFS transporter permease subunit [Fructilactobacillus fructivorans]MCT2868571.1 DHA2 family efflux MFS transporter permease subunit [Fructilactobacillus fructivorans]MCT2873571.1 DHA2 family efflux MFS transporte
MKGKTNVKVVTIALFVATFMSAVEGTIVSTAMPTIVGDLHGVSLMNWVFSIFLLTNSIATPIYGKLADQLGRKSVFIFGLVVFVIGSMLSGMSNSMGTLILWRAVQGVGAGVIMPVSFTIIADMYSFEKRAQIVGLNGSAWGIASVVAPLLGGFLVDNLSWHWVFFINVPIGILTIVLIALFLHEPKRKIESKMDLPGVVLIAVLLFSIMYMFQVLSEAPINWVMVIGCLIVALVSGFLFYKQEKRAADPLIPIQMFKSRTFVTQNLIAALISGFIFGYEVYLPDWTQGILGLKATMAGFAITPSSVLWLIGSFVSGKMILKYRPQQIMNFSLSFILVGAICMVFLPISTPFWIFFVLSAVLGTGFGITITTSTVTVQNEVPPEHVGVASSFNTLSRTLGQTIMISIFGIVMNTSMAKGVSNHPGTSLKMMNTLINPQTAVNLSEKVLPVLHEILYTAIHNIFILALLLVILSYVVNWFDHKKMQKKTN